MPVVLNYSDMNNHSDFADVTLRYVTDNFGKHTLTDVKEENEEDAVATRRIGSMDTIWDTHPHRLSEAGLSRHQDNSILTEDTDSFIIGDRVWVGGSKPGQIAYIGETQFAPGEWAGIVLDQAIGKNDGSVGGVHYFQCEAKRGVFSRLTRLTRTALPGADDVSICSSSYLASSTPINNGIRRRVESPVSPTGSVKSSLKTPPPFNVSNTSLSSIPHVIDFKVGDRVIIKSTQGSKVGTLRYIGATDFAPGEWCGVELDEPRGKNNGSVEGKKYFECAPLFGLFAPANKVSKSPLKYKPGNCVIHTGAGATTGTLPPSGIKRMGSKESITSMNSSITSAASGARRVRLGINSLTPQKTSPKPVLTPAYPTRSALQDVLREKQQHIEQLLKERDLDRLEFSKAATHAEDVTQKLTSLKVEYEQYRLETESKLREYVDVLTKLNKDRTITLSELDDEKRKNEDLQFKFEEAAITKSDVEVNNKTKALKIEELEAQLVSERQKLNNIEGDSNKLFEAEEALVETREELDELNKKMATLTKQNEELVKEQSLSAESITDLKHNLEKVSSELKTIRNEDAKTIAKLQQDINTASLSNNETCSNLTKEIDSRIVQLQEKSDFCQKQTEEITALRLELEQHKELAKQNNDKLCSSTESESKLSSAVDKLKQELSSKIFDLENSAEIIKERDNEIANLKAQHESAKSQGENTNLAIETKYKNEIEQFKSQINTKNEENKIISIKLEEVNKLLVQSTGEKEKLTAELKNAKEHFERTISENKVQYDKDIGSKTSEITEMATELQYKAEEINKTSTTFKQLQDEIANKHRNIEELQKEVQTSQNRFENEHALTSKLNEQIQSLQLNAGDLQRKITAAEQQIAELTEHKVRVEGDMGALISSSGDYSEKMQKLNDDLKEKDKLLSSTKTEYVEKIQQLEHGNQAIQLQLEGVRQEAERTKTTYEEKLQAVRESETSFRERFEKASRDLEKSEAQFNDLQRLSNDINARVKVADEEQVRLESELNSAKSLSTDNCLKIEQLTVKLEEKEILLRQTNIDLDQKLQSIELTNQQQRIQIENLQSELERNKLATKEKSKTSQETEERLRKSNDDIKTNLEKAEIRLAELQSIINEKEAALKTVAEEKHNLATNFNNAVSSSEDTNAKLQQLTSDLTMHENLIISTKAELAESAQQLSKTKVELSDVQALRDELSGKLQTHVEAQTKLQEQYDVIFSDKQKALLDLTTFQHLIASQELTLKENLENETNLKRQLETISGKLQETAETYRKTVDELNMENSRMKEELSKKTEIETKLKQQNDQEIEKSKTSTNELERFQLELKTKNDEIHKLKTEVDVLKQNSTDITEKDGRIARLNTELQTTQQLATQLQIDKGNLELEKIDVGKQLTASNQQTNDLANQVAALNSKIDLGNKLSEDLKVEKNRYVQIFENLRLTEKQKQQLVTSLEGTLKQNGERSTLELAKTIPIGAIDEQRKSVVELHHSLETMRQELKDSKNQLQNQQSEVLRLQETLTKSQQKTSSMGVQNGVHNNNNNAKSDDRQQLIEEKQLAEGQIQFLNAIIVDMQRKNEEQRMRIELLESGFSPSAASELKLYGMPSGTVAPRMYCDICEEFDKHQTEDCPIQGSDYDAPASHTHTKKNVPERPYCDICEVFGHSTEDCKEDETF